MMDADSFIVFGNERFGSAEIIHAGMLSGAETEIIGDQRESSEISVNLRSIPLRPPRLCGENRCAW